MEDAEIEHIASEFRKGLLGDKPSHGMCFMVCLPLQGYLSFLGLETLLDEVDFGEECPTRFRNHCWLRMADNRIIDPTADQFACVGVDLPKVYVGYIPTVYRQWLSDAASLPLVKKLAKQIEAEEDARILEQLSKPPTRRRRRRA